MNRSWMAGTVLQGRIFISSSRQRNQGHSSRPLSEVRVTWTFASRISRIGSCGWTVERISSAVMRYSEPRTLPNIAFERFSALCNPGVNREKIVRGGTYIHSFWQRRQANELYFDYRTQSCRQTQVFQNVALSSHDIVDLISSSYCFLMLGF